MDISKRGFIESLQARDQLLSPHHISQLTRLAIGCVSICSFDPKLDVDILRGYMKRDQPKVDRSAENPELFDCVVATQQSQAWQYVVWIKEILQIFDHVEERTKTTLAFIEMLRLRSTINNGSDMPSVKADKNGFVLAMGSAVPSRYRDVLRKEKFLTRYSLDELEKILFVPKEKIEFLLGDQFEGAFEKALISCR